MSNCLTVGDFLEYGGVVQTGCWNLLTDAEREIIKAVYEADGSDLRITMRSAEKAGRHSYGMAIDFGAPKSGSEFDLEKLFTVYLNLYESWRFGGLGLGDPSVNPHIHLDYGRAPIKFLEIGKPYRTKSGELTVDYVIQKNDEIKFNQLLQAYSEKYRPSDPLTWDKIKNMTAAGFGIVGFLAASYVGWTLYSLIKKPKRKARPKVQPKKGPLTITIGRN